MLSLISGGCSLSFPIAWMVPGADDVTGSNRPAPGQMADDEDRRRAKAALSTALDPQGPGTPVSWDNPVSGNKGTVFPVGHAYPTEAHVCRAFEQTLHQNGVEKSARGTACAMSAGEWSVTLLYPVAKS